MLFLPDCGGESMKTLTWVKCLKVTNGVGLTQ